MIKDSRFEDLRKKAEEILQSRGIDHSVGYINDVQKLIEELNVYHIELEMQNQELKLSNQRIIEERQKYRELYQYAPVAYFTINETGNIYDINNAAAFMLGMSIQSFNKTSIFPYIDSKSKIEFANFVKEVFISSFVKDLEIKFIDNSGHIIFAQISAQSYYDDFHKKHLCRFAATDITKQTTYENLLQQQNELLMLAFDNEKVAWWDWDYLSGEVRFSPNKATMLGYTIEEFPTNVYEVTGLIHPDDYDEAMEVMRDHLMGLTPFYEVSYRIRTKDGFYVYYYDFGKVIERTSDGKPKRVNGIVFNLSEQKQYEFELMRAKDRAEINEQRLTLALISGELGIWDLDIVNNKLIWDDRMYELYGISKDTFTSNVDAWINGLHPDDKEFAINEFNLAKEGIKEFNLNFRVVHPDGKIINIKADAVILRDDFGSIVRMIGINKDITLEKAREVEIIKAKEKAEEGEKKIRGMFDNTQIGILYCNTEGRILEANSSILKILGSPSLEHSLQINLLTHQSLLEIGFSQNLAKCIESKEIVSDENEYISRWGKSVYLKYQFFPIVINDKVLGVWINLNDVTNLWQIQRELTIAKERSEESDRLKTAFLQNISHEIRTPLNGILGFSNLLKQNDISNEDIIEYTDIIKKSSYRLLETISNILDISKIETGQIEIRNRKFHLNELIKDTYNFFNYNVSLKGLEFSFNLDLNQELIIVGDNNRINQILTHLIDNSIKFTSKGFIEFGYKVKDDNIEFYVQDTGIGIPNNHKDRIFKRFSQADLSLSRGYEGNGLGLSICKGLVELMNGNIWFESQENDGCTFYFSIPFNKKLQGEL